MASKKSKKRSNAKGKGGKKSAKKAEETVIQPGYPYGADPWVEAQPITLPEVPPGQIRTAIPIGQIMPTRALDAEEVFRQKIRDADQEAVVEDAQWQEKIRHLKAKIREVTEDLNKQKAVNRFMQTLLTVNEKDANQAIQELSQRGKDLRAQLEIVENQHRKIVSDQILQQQATDANNHGVIISLEKEVAARDYELHQLAAEHLELRRLEEDRDILQSSIGELRRMVYASEKDHQRTLMIADQKRRVVQRKTQADAEAKLQQLAKRGAKAALDNIAHQTQQIDNETVHNSLSFRWVCDKVRRKRDEVNDLKVLLDELILDHDAVVSACEGKIRECKRSRKTILDLSTAVQTAEAENIVATVQMRRDSEDVTMAVEHAFYDKDKEINILEATQTALQTELQKQKQIVRQCIADHDLVEEFLVSSIMSARKMKMMNSDSKDKEVRKNYDVQLRAARKGQQHYPPFRLSANIRVNQTLLRYSNVKIPSHEDISQLDWAEKEAVLQILFRYLCEYRTFGRSGKKRTKTN